MIDVVERLVPFNSHDDIVRIQMAATHSKQAIPLINAQVPFVRNVQFVSHLRR